MLVKTYANQRIKFGRGPFQIHRNFPGINLGDPNDHGIAGLGCIDHSEVAPNFTVKMEKDEALREVHIHLEIDAAYQPPAGQIVHQ